MMQSARIPAIALRHRKIRASQLLSKVWRDRDPAAIANEPEEITMNEQQLEEFLLQALEHEQGGIRVYQTALECVLNDELKKEWEKYLEQTRHHAEVLTEVCREMDIDPERQSPGRVLVGKMGQMLVAAMKEAMDRSKPEAAELVACECVVLAETKDHMNWQLIGKCAQKLGGEKAAKLKEAYEEIEDQEDEHLYHSKGWCRELWIQALGMPAVLPPPEEEKDAKSAVAAAKAEKASEKGRFN